MRYSSDISKLNKHPLNRVCYGHLRQLDHVDSISEGEQYYQQYMLWALAEDGIPKEYFVNRPLTEELFYDTIESKDQGKALRDVVEMPFGHPTANGDPHFDAKDLWSGWIAAMEVQNKLPIKEDALPLRR